ncbi:MAG: hypothetical protein H6735_22955 [Alphaproteobacteria bacterium]|nr:hypothetical protein [Alphaproteobacteria bacterium]
MNDPFVQRYGMAANVELATTRAASFELRAGWFPDLGELDYRAITKQIVSYNQVYPDISRLGANGQLAIRITPVQGYVGPLRLSYGWLFGIGACHTRDDLEILFQAESPTYLATERQWHPAGVYGVVVDVSGERVGVRIRYQGFSYLEVVGSTTVEMKNNVMVAPELVWWL